MYFRNVLGLESYLKSHAKLEPEVWDREDPSSAWLQVSRQGRSGHLWAVAAGVRRRRALWRGCGFRRWGKIEGTPEGRCWRSCLLGEYITSVRMRGRWWQSQGWTKREGWQDGGRIGEEAKSEMGSPGSRLGVHTSKEAEWVRAEGWPGSELASCWWGLEVVCLRGMGWLWNAALECYLEHAAVGWWFQAQILELACWVQIPALPLSSCSTVGRWLNLLCLQFLL